MLMYALVVVNLAFANVIVDVPFLEMPITKGYSDVN